MAILDTLRTPVLIAPMAGGPSTPALVNAAAAAGTLGFLATGATGVETVRSQLSQLHAPFGVNLFRPQEEQPDPGDLEQLTELLAPAFAEHGLDRPTVPTPDLSYGWTEKFAAAVAARPAVISCTFGIFSAAEFHTLKHHGIEAWVTVTTPEDARRAAVAGADVLVVQGPEAGGHRSTWHIGTEPDPRPLEELLAAVLEVVEIPVVAAGGLATAADVARVLGLGAAAAACGSAFLLCPEAGTSAQNRALLNAARDEGAGTVSTRAFSGRFARGIPGRFTHEQGNLPPVYPYLNALLTPLRASAAARSNWDYAYCLVGTGLGRISGATAEQIIADLSPSEFS